jgi:alkylhydroperoxidase/carboxymuconolactone decarboxylase family protein YurZ
MHAAITASLHDAEATVMHLTGAVKAGAMDQEILETAFTINALRRVKPSLIPGWG